MTSENDRSYREGAAYKATQKRYRQSAKGKAAAKRYQQTHPKKRPPPPPEKRRKYERRHRAKAARDRPFVGCDGEGFGTDDLGRQHYMLFRMGDRELYTGAPLTTLEILEFILEAPRGPIYVGFSFGYDITMILRDLDFDTRAKLFPDDDDHLNANTVWNGIGINLLHRNHLRISRMHPERSHKSVSNSTRYIYETFGFFQKSFVNALEDFAIATPEEKTEIAANKAERGLVPIGSRQRDYCALECDLLARMLEKFRTNCAAIITPELPTGLRPRTWNGAGKLATALHRAYGTMRADRLAEVVPPGVLEAAQAAYYGGRFEVTRHGKVAGPIYEYDLNSAYPAMMLKLPCLEHGTWAKLSPKGLAKLPPETLYVAPVSFTHAPVRPSTGPGDSGRSNIFGLPVRDEFSGRISWPREANGTYWSVEINAGRKLGCVPTFTGAGWAYHTDCHCQPFQWVQTLYTERKRLGKSAAGYPLKLAINALYGQLARRVGQHPPYANMVWAGLITAHTRAALIEAAAVDPDAIAMIATDGILSVRPLAVPIGADLGQWEGQTRGDVFVVQPGVYWFAADVDGIRKQKTRGVSLRHFSAIGVADEFEAAWLAFRDTARDTQATPAPVVKLHIEQFIGLKLAQARNRPDTAGCWQTAAADPQGPNQCKLRDIAFEWIGKRGAPRTWEGDALWTYPRQGGPDLFSIPHKSDPTHLAAMDLDLLEGDDQPDWIGEL